MSVIAVVLNHPFVTWGIQIIGLTLLAAMTTASAAWFYRMRFHERLPDGASLIIGLGIVAVYLNTQLFLIEYVIDDGDPLEFGRALATLAVFVFASMGSLAGLSAGDRFGESERFTWARVDMSLNPIVRATGRYITVTLPDDIEDIEGYDPVSAETKTAIAGLSMDFPRGLTVQALESQLIERLTDKHDIGYVDVDLTAEGSVSFIAVGQRAAGLGPSLPTGTAAVALRADPPFSATPGDTVEIWLPGEDVHVGTAELRASVESGIVTVVCSKAVADRIDPDTTYRLMTLPAEIHVEREFALILRRHETTMGVIDIDGESQLVGTSLGDIDGAVMAVQHGQRVETIPPTDRTIAAEDRLFILARPEGLRALEQLQGVTSTSTSTAVEAAEIDAEELIDELVPDAGVRESSRSDYSKDGRTS